MTAERVIALLGRRDEPTDAVEDYCRYLGQALVRHNVQLEIRRVPWNQRGWSASVEALRLQAETWRGNWILVQYTALAWSVRGFPRRFLQVLRTLRKSGAKIAVVFHDAEPFGGRRMIDRLRRMLQLHVMRTAIALADHAVLTVAPEKLAWTASSPKKFSFIPVGANLPFPLDPQRHDRLHSPPTIGIFSITGGTAGDRETRAIVAAVRYASRQLGSLRLTVFGRHAEVREAVLRESLKDVSVELDVTGVLDDQALVAKFAAADLLLFVRGTISSRRGSAIAGIACGLPVIAVEGSETAPPITSAGVVLVPGNLDEKALQLQLGQALVAILSENDLRLQLAQRSCAAHEQFFSWPAIAKRYAEVLQPLEQSNARAAQKE
jgi:glycosyltransferase involved in cell wall biosynthesis